MTILGCDYSFSRPSPGTLVSLGIKFAARYYSTPGNQKNLTGPERDGLLAHGIDIVSVYETSAGAARGDYAAGVAAAKSAGAQAAGLRQPHGTCIYYAVDFDATITQVLAYFKGIAATDNGYSWGVYGSYSICQNIRNRFPQAFAWQTLAWSQGRLLQGVHIYQDAHTFGGYPDLDVDYAYNERYGSWKSTPGPADAPQAPPLPKADSAMAYAGAVGAVIGTDGQIYLTLDDWATDFPVKLTNPKIAYLPGLDIDSYPLEAGQDPIIEYLAAVTRFPDKSVHVVEISIDLTRKIANGSDWAIKGGFFADTGSISIRDKSLYVAGKGTDPEGHIYTARRTNGVWGFWVKRAGRAL